MRRRPTRPSPLSTLLGASLLAAAFLAFVPPAVVSGATRTWTGLGADNLWSTPANWSSSLVPGASDTAVFDATSAKPVTIGANTSVQGISVASTYGGAITQAAGATLTVGSVGYSQAGSSFSGSAAAISTSSFAVTGGAFTSTSGTLTVTGAFTINGGTFADNTGTVLWSGGNATVSTPAGVTFNALTINSTGTKTISDTVTVNSALTLTDGQVATGTVQARGDVSQASGFDGGTGTLRIDGAGAQAFSGSANVTTGALPNVVVDKSSGTLTLSGTIRTARNWTHTAGTIAPTGSTLVLAGTLGLSGSFPLDGLDVRGTITQGASDLVTVAGALNLFSGTVNAGTIAARGSIDQQIGFTGTNTSTLRIDGTGGQTFTGSATTAAGALPNVVVDKSSGTLTLAGTIRTARNWTHTAGTIAPTGSTLILNGTQTVSGSFPLDSLDIRGTVTLGAADTITVAGTLNLFSGSLNTGTVSAHGAINQQIGSTGTNSATIRIEGTGAQTFTGFATATTGTLPNVVIDKPSGTLSLAGTIRTARNWTYTAGTLDPGTSTLVLAGTQSIGGTFSLANLNLQSSGAKTFSGTVTVTGTTTLGDGSIETGTVAAHGDISQASAFDNGTGTLRIEGTGGQTFTGTATTTTGQLPNVVIDKPSGTLSLAGTIRTARNWTYTAGTLDPGTSTLVLAGTQSIGGTFSLANLNLQSSGAKTFSGTVTVTGTTTLGDGSIETGTVAAHGDISQASAFDNGTGTLRIEGTGGQTFTGTATTTTGQLPNVVIDKPSGTLSLAGTIRTARNWTYTAGTLDPGTSTLVLAGGTVSGGHGLANLEIRGTTTVAAGTALTLSGGFTMPSSVTLTLDGTITVAGTTTLTDGTLNGTGSLSVRGDISQASTYDGGAATIRIEGTGAQTFTGSATPTAGSLPIVVIDKPSGTLSLVGTIRTGANWTYIGGTLDAGTSLVVFAGTQTIGGTFSLADVTFVNSNTKTITDTLTVSGTLALTDGPINTGTIVALGDLSMATTSDTGTATIRIEGTGAQTFTGSATPTAGSLPIVVIDKPSGTLSLVGTIRTGANWTYIGGTLDAGTSLVVFAGTQTIGGTFSLADVTFVNSNTKTITDTLTVSGTLALTDGPINTGTIVALGDLSMATTSDTGTATIRIEGTGAQTFTGSATPTAGSLPIVVIDKPSGTLSLVGTIRTGANWTYIGGTLDAGTSLVVFAGTQTIGGTFSLADVTFDGTGAKSVSETLTTTGTLTLTNGSINGGTVAAAGDVAQGSSFDGGTGTLRFVGPGTQTFTGSATTSAGTLPDVVIDTPGTVTLVGTIRTTNDWTLTSGTIDPGTSTVVFSGAMTITGPFDLATAILDGAGSKTVVGTVTVTGPLTLTNGSIDGGTIAAMGAVSAGPSFDGGTGTLRFVGPGAQTFTGTASTTSGTLPDVIVDTTDTVTLAGTIRTTNDWTFTAGTIDPGTSTLVFAGTLTIGGTGAVPFADVEIRSGTVTAAAPLDVAGHLDVVSGTLVLSASGQSSVAGDLTVTGTLQLASSDLAVDGDTTVAGTLALGSSELTLAGDLTVTGILDSPNGSLTLVGPTAQTIGGTADVTVGLLTIDTTAMVTLGTDLTAAAGIDFAAAGTLDPAGHVLTIGGPITGFTAGLLLGPSDTLVIDGTTSGITLPATVTTLGTFRVANPSGVTLLGPLSVTTLLDLADGPILATGGTLTVQSGAVVTRTTGWVAGALRLPVPTGTAVAVRFDVGDATTYAPVTLVFDQVTTAGSIVVTSIAGDHADAMNPIDTTKSVNRHWTVINEQVVFTSYDITLAWASSDVDPGADPATFVVAKLDGTAWTLPGVDTRTATSITAGGLTSMSEFAVGDGIPDVVPPETAAVPRDVAAAPVLPVPMLAWILGTAVGGIGYLLLTNRRRLRSGPPASSRPDS